MGLANMYRSYSNLYYQKLNQAVDKALDTMSQELIRNAKKIAPHATGELASSIKAERASAHNYKVSAGSSGPSQAYARRREFEENVKFSKPGRQAHYMSSSADNVRPKANMYIERFMR